MFTPKAADVGDPVRVIEVEPLVSPVPTELPPAEAPIEEPEREEVEALR